MTICMLLVGCGGKQPELAVWLKNGQFAPHTVDEGYPVVVVRKNSGPVRRVYIEGDGRAYITAYESSGDPTPVNPVGLKLFMADPEEGVMFVGRPCQWVRTPVCKDRGIWTERRFTQEMVELYMKVMAKEVGGQPVELVGYSGGAWIAMQLAARLPNVTGVRTVAGNVDPAEVNRLYGASVMEVAPWPGGNRLHDVPQVHLVGTRDKIVTAVVVGHYKAEIQPTCARVEMVEASHGEGWESDWGARVGRPLVCGE